MAFISKQCVTCTEPTKRECGMYYGSDENGKYSGSMYLCDNEGCKIYYTRKKAQRQIFAVEEQGSVSISQNLLRRIQEGDKRQKDGEIKYREC